MTVSRVERGGLRIAQELDDLVKNAIAPGTGIDVEAFWSGFETCLDELGPLNRELLSVRDEFTDKLGEKFYKKVIWKIMKNREKYM